MSKPTVVLYRMKLPDHECPFGLKARQMLEDAGISFEEKLLTRRRQVDQFEDEQGVMTTPQVFIDGKRIGGSEELAAYLRDKGA